jgi:hypothetical protein
VRGTYDVLFLRCYFVRPLYVVVCTFTYFSVSLSVCILQIAGPFVFGLLLSKYDPKLCVKLAVGVMVITLPILVIIAASFLRVDEVF